MPNRQMNGQSGGRQLKILNKDPQGVDEGTTTQPLANAVSTSLESTMKK
jgi:hypothetical protein